jgi:hypothetical protein
METYVYDTGSPIEDRGSDCRLWPTQSLAERFISRVKPVEPVSTGRTDRVYDPQPGYVPNMTYDAVPRPVDRLAAWVANLTFDATPSEDEPIIVTVKPSDPAR